MASNGLQSPKGNYKEFGMLIIPLIGDIYIDKISKKVSKSKLERITLDIGLYTFKYLAIGSLFYSIYKMFNELYTWQAGADILKGV